MQLHSRTVRGKNVVHHERAGAAEVLNRSRTCGGIADKAAGDAGFASLMHDRAVCKRAVDAAAAQAQRRSVRRVDGIARRAGDLHVLERQSRAVPCIDRCLRLYVGAVPLGDLQCEVPERQRSGGTLDKNRKASIRFLRRPFPRMAAGAHADADVLQIVDRRLGNSAEIEAAMIRELIDRARLQLAAGDALHQLVRCDFVDLCVCIIARSRRECVVLQAAAGRRHPAHLGLSLLNAGIVKIDLGVVNCGRKRQAVMPVVGLAAVNAKINIFVLLDAQEHRLEVHLAAVRNVGQRQKVGDDAVTGQLHAIVAAVARVGRAGAVHQPHAVLHVQLQRAGVGRLERDDRIIHAARQKLTVEHLRNVVAVEITRIPHRPVAVIGRQLCRLVLADRRIKIVPVVLALRAGELLLVGIVRLADELIFLIQICIIFQRGIFRRRQNIQTVFAAAFHERGPDVEYIARSCSGNNIVQLQDRGFPRRRVALDNV